MDDWCTQKKGNSLPLAGSRPAGAWLHQSENRQREPVRSLTNGFKILVLRVRAAPERWRESRSRPLASSLLDHHDSPALTSCMSSVRRPVFCVMYRRAYMPEPEYISCTFINDIFVHPGRSMGCLSPLPASVQQHSRETVSLHHHHHSTLWYLSSLCWPRNISHDDTLFLSSRAATLERQEGKGTGRSCW
jgi:hypothetical protein